jgi:hypothetical protein
MIRSPGAPLKPPRPCVPVPDSPPLRAFLRRLGKPRPKPPEGPRQPE